MLVVFLGFVTTVVLGFVNPIYAARLELHIGTFGVLITSILTLVGTFVAVHNRWGLIGVVACTIGTTAVMQWIFAIWTLVWPRNRTNSGRTYHELRAAQRKRIYKTGIDFFIYELVQHCLFQIDRF